jgi:drug/metabolite transporter (DMT)-like permease
MSATVFGIILVILCAFIEGFSQVFFKKSVMIAASREVWVALGVILFILQFALYAEALSYLNLSIAFPISSLSFVAVVILSQWLLGETVTKMRWIGVVLILIGTGLLVTQA